VYARVFVSKEPSIAIVGLFQHKRLSMQAVSYKRVAQRDHGVDWTIVKKAQ